MHLSWENYLEEASKLAESEFIKTSLGTSILTAPKIPKWQEFLLSPEI